MLDLFGKPSVKSTSPTFVGTPVSGGKPSFAELRVYTAARTDLTASTRTRYVNAVDRVADIQNRPLAAIEADLESVAARFPLNGFDLDHWPTESAYQTFRRRVLAAQKSFLGVHAQKARLRAAQDEWAVLLAAIKPRTEARVGTADWHPMKLAMLTSFALTAASARSRDQLRGPLPGTGQNRNPSSLGKSVCRLGRQSHEQSLGSCYTNVQ